MNRTDTAPAHLDLLPAAQWPDGVRQVAQVLSDAGHAEPPQVMKVPARTAQQAADVLGVALGQIAKSVVFRRLGDDAAVLVVAAGDQRVDEAKVAARVGAIGRADAAFVKARTGFSIGGVSPVGHAEKPVLLIDASLARFDCIWAAAGHPHGVFPLTLADLVRLSDGAPVLDVVVTAADGLTGASAVAGPSNGATPA
ncbi:MAG: YbaK/EbsC family protein [Leptothrix sp. (in: b-proteobacteria)]